MKLLSEDLTPQEVERLTGQRRLDMQARDLVKRGIPFRFGAGVICVRRAVAEELPIWQAKADAKPRMDLVN